MKSATIKESLNVGVAPLIESVMQRQAEQRKRIASVLKHSASRKPRAKRITTNDVNKAVAEALRDLARGLRHEIKITPGWRLALGHACAMLEAKARDHIDGADNMVEGAFGVAASQGDRGKT